MGYSQETVAEDLHSIKIGMDNAVTDPDITAARDGVGYDEAEMNIGRTKYETAYEAYIARDLEYGDQISTSQDLRDLRDEANQRVTRHMKYARIAFKKNPAALNRLDITGYWKKSIIGKIDQATHFYEALLASKELLQGMERFRISGEELEQAKELVSQVKGLLGERTSEAGEAQQSTAERDQVLDDLEDWWGDFIAVMKIELADKPQLLEKLGVKVK